MATISTTSSKKFINSVENSVDECLHGLVCANDHLRYISKHRIVIRSDYKKLQKDGKVAILSGGGAGHEPFAAGFVGKGMITAAVAGPVFRSPPASRILAALRLLGDGNQAGTLMIVANYTGDRLNFGMAAEEAKSGGHRIEMVLVKDDCALASTDKSAGRRGLCGIVLTMKVAGAMAESGHTLDDIVTVLNELTGNLGSIGLSLTPCSIPGSGPNFKLAEDEVELGLGVHGEAGVSRMKIRPAKELINIMLTHMTNPESVSHLPLNKGDKIVLLVNNLGGTSNLEMGIVTREAILWLESQGLIILRVFCSPVMTALEMAGITINILNAAERYVQFIDAKTKAPCWPKSYQMTKKRDETLNRSSLTLFTPSDLLAAEIQQDKSTFAQLHETTSVILKKAIEKSCMAVIAAKQLLNDLDRSCGDGDCGNALSSGAQGILDALEDKKIDILCPFCALQQISKICQRTMGGASGALYSVFFLAASVPLKTELSINALKRGVRLGAAAIRKYGGAECGDRTMLDSLMKGINALHASSHEALVDIMEEVAEAAQKGADDTATMRAKAGRASYVSPERCTRPDPGAQAVAIIFRAVYEALKDDESP